MRDGVHVQGNRSRGERLTAREKAADVSGDVNNVNGGIHVEGAHIGGNIDTSQGNIDLGPNAHIDGNVVIEKDNSWHFGFFSVPPAAACRHRPRHGGQGEDALRARSEVVRQRPRHDRRRRGRPGRLSFRVIIRRSDSRANRPRVTSARTRGSDTGGLTFRKKTRRDLANATPGIGLTRYLAASSDTRGLAAPDESDGGIFRPRRPAWCDCVLRDVTFRRATSPRSVRRRSRV